MQVTRVTASIDFPLPLRIDLGESEQITEFPQLREPIDKESSQEKGPAESWEYIFHFFTAPSPYPFSALVQPSIYVLYRHRGNMIAMSKTRKRIGGGRGGDIIDETRDRWIASWIIPFLSRSLDFFFPLSSFFQWYFITFPMIVLEQLSRNWRSSVIERLLKKKKKQGYICRTKIGILFDINECLLLFLPRICPVPRQTFPIVRVRGKGNSRKRNVYITRREGNIIETLRTIEYFYEEGGSRERSLA